MTNKPTMLDPMAQAMHPTEPWRATFCVTDLSDWDNREYCVYVTKQNRGTVYCLIPTYSSFSGCGVEYLGWYQDWVVIVYADKHDYFVATIASDAAVSSQAATLTKDEEGPIVVDFEGRDLVKHFDWYTLSDDFIGFYRKSEKRLQRFHLPDLAPMSDLNDDEIKRLDIEDHVFDGFC
jgi:hypothetical protein